MQRGIRKFTAKYRVPSSRTFLEKFLPSKQWRGYCWQVVCLFIWFKKMFKVIYWECLQNVFKCCGWFACIPGDGLKQGRTNEDMFAIRSIIYKPLKLIPLQDSCWKSPKHFEVLLLLEHVKKRQTTFLWLFAICFWIRNITSNSYRGQFNFSWY